MSGFLEITVYNMQQQAAMWQTDNNRVDHDFIKSMTYARHDGGPAFLSTGFWRAFHWFTAAVFEIFNRKISK